MSPLFRGTRRSLLGSRAAATPAPSGLTYSTNPAIYTRASAITTNSPTVTGTVTSYSVSPSLPTGLSLNTSTGAITGTPSATTASAAYTVTATNAGGSTTCDVTITVAAAAANISWSQATNVTGQADGGISKTGGVDGDWDAGGSAPTQLFAGDMTVSAVISNSKDAMIGLSDTTTVVSYTGIDYALQVSPGWGKLGVWENGVNKLNPNVGQAFIVGDTVSVVRSSNTVTYKRNGVTFYTSLTSAAGLTLKASASLASTGEPFSSGTVTY
jgi:hypothetical protein